MNVKQKIMLGSALLTAIPVILSSLVLNNVATDRARTTLETQIDNQLVSIREIKKTQINDYFGTIHNQALTLSNDNMIIDALQQFKDTFNNYLLTATNISDIAPLKAKLATYYNQDFSQQYKKLNQDEAIDTAKLLGGLSDEGIALQYQYIFANPNPIGEKDALLAANDNSGYSFTHESNHPHIRDFLQRFGYQEIFLVDIDTGIVVYSVFKNLDYGTSLKTGPYADSGLGKAFKGAAAADKPDHVEMVDFAPYLPSYNASASFIASPIFDNSGEKTGVLIFQMPVDHINEMMTNHARWKYIGLGDSGETYIVGSDYLMRSKNRFMIEDKAGFLAAAASAGTPQQQIAAINAKDNTTGLFKIQTAATEAALNGETGTNIIPDYRGVPMLSAYTPLDILGLKWALLAEIEKEEAFRDVHALQASITTTALLVAVALIALGLVAGWFYANGITRPILRLSKTMDEIEQHSDLTLRTDVSSNDEIGHMASSLNSILDKFQNIVQQVFASTTQLSSAAEELSVITAQTTNGI